MSSKTFRSNKLFRTLLAIIATISIGFTAVAFSGATPAAAAPLQEHQFIFTDPKGTDWVVPDGVTEVLVGIRGGDGGCHYCSQPGGQGQSYLLQLDVKPGDTLKIYPGTTPESYKRSAGLGFVNGGTGGDKSRSAAVGAGGGGAAAVKLNGELLAVAGGGGGGGGRGGDREFRPFSYDFDFGGAGGDARYGAEPTWGEGKHAGNPGTNGRDESNFSRYQKSGGNGGSAGTLSSGGGGGAGGGGWPASGTGGGSGKKKLGFGAGSGGGAGMSWVDTDNSALTVLETALRPDLDWVYSGPQATENVARVTIPLKTSTDFTGPQTVTSTTPFDLKARTIDPVFGEGTVDGSYVLLRDGTKIAEGTTDGDLTLPNAGLAAGSYVFTYIFTPKHNMGKYWNDRAVTTSELRVTVDAAAPSTSNADALPDETAGEDGAGNRTAETARPESDLPASESETPEHLIGDDDSCDVDLPVSDTVQWK